MAAVQQNWRSPSSNLNPLASSASVRGTNISGNVRLMSSHGDHYRPGTGQKRQLHEDERSMASKYSRYTYNSRYTMKIPTWPIQTRSTSNVTSISTGDYFKPGTMILADHFEEAYGTGSVPANEKSVIRVPGQKDICKKARFFIVLAAHAESYISLPVYSHNGNGTKNKPKPEEYVSIRDHRATSEAPSQSIHEPVVTEHMSGSVLLSTSVIHLTYPVSRKYIVPIKVVGKLNAQSISRLTQLFTGYMPAKIAETSEPISSSSKGVEVCASMSVSDALESVSLHRYAGRFGELSWNKAATMGEGALIEMGIKGPEDCKKLLRFFEKVKIAKRASTDWKMTIDPDSLVAT